MNRPETCAALPDRMVCPSKTYPFRTNSATELDPDALDAGGFACYRPEDIEPFLERCGK